MQRFPVGNAAAEMQPAIEDTHSLVPRPLAPGIVCNQSLKLVDTEPAIVEQLAKLGGNAISVDANVAGCASLTIHFGNQGTYVGDQCVGPVIPDLIRDLLP